MHLLLGLACFAIIGAHDAPLMIARDSIELRLVIPSEVHAGTVAPITLRVENRGKTAVDLYLRGRSITFDLVVSRPDGTVVWRRLEGEIIPAVVHLRALAAGEVLELRASWDQRAGDGRAVPPGAYLIRGQLLTDGPSMETTPVRFLVTP